MQYLPVYLYANNLVITLDLDSTVKGTNDIMYQRDLKIQKGLKNQIRIQFKNSDQKRIRIFNTQTFVFNMFDSVNQRLLLEKPLEVLDQGTTSTKGLALLTLTENDTATLDRSSYQFAIKIRDTDGSYAPTYSNTYYDIAGTLHLSNDIEPVLASSDTLTSFLKTYNPTISKFEYTSEKIYAKPEFNGNTPVHTAGIYLTNYKGELHIQATLDNNPGVNADYSNIFVKTYNGFTGADFVNFQGIFSYVRFKFIPKINPTTSNNEDPEYRGTFDKILYRS